MSPKRPVECPCGGEEDPPPDLEGEGGFEVLGQRYRLDEAHLALQLEIISKTIKAMHEA